MTVFVAEINGRAIAAFNAENEIHAGARCTDLGPERDKAVKTIRRYAVEAMN